MFVIDDLVREFLSYIKESRLQDREARRAATLNAHNAMADLAKVFALVETDMRREILRLSELREDSEGFERQLKAMRFHDAFWYYTNDAFCHDLAAARASLIAVDADDKQMKDLIWFLDDHRLGFIAQVQMLIWQCGDEQSDRDTVIQNLKEALAAVSAIRADVGAALNDPAILEIPASRRKELAEARSVSTRRLRP